MYILRGKKEIREGKEEQWQEREKEREREREKVAYGPGSNAVFFSLLHPVLKIIYLTCDCHVYATSNSTSLIGLHPVDYYHVFDLVIEQKFKHIIIIYRVQPNIS